MNIYSLYIFHIHFTSSVFYGAQLKRSALFLILTGRIQKKELKKIYKLLNGHSRIANNRAQKTSIKDFVIWYGKGDRHSGLDKDHVAGTANALKLPACALKGFARLAS